jgi:outer membrane autotransporter protein
MTSILALGRIDLSPNPKATPYAIAGVGWVRNSLTVTSASQVLVDDSKSTLGFALGLGMDLALTDRVFLGIEGRYQGSVKHSFDTTPAGQAATGQTQVTVPLGAYLFGAIVGVKY